MKVKKFGIAGAVLAVILACYYLKGGNKPVAPVTEQKREIAIGKDMLEDDIRSTVNRAVDTMRDSEKYKEKRLQALETIAQQIKDGPATNASALGDVSTDANMPPSAPVGKPTFPAAPNYHGNTAEYSDSKLGVASVEQVKIQFVGGIGHAAGTVVSKTDDTKKKRTVYLPPSFMEGMVLTGIEADAGENARGEPEPIIIRVQAPAQLPNELKANLKGCFVVANAIGRLNKERVDPRLVSLNCMLTNGDAVIDQEVKGMVVDADGKKGLAGIVVSKQGALVARAVAAGAFAGLGQSVATSNTTTQISPLGTTQTIDTDRALQSGLAQGVKSGANEIQKLYIDLIKQSTPVIEIGAEKPCTVVITEGVQLEIKETKTL
jgi:conjugal transfer pilus assembly protein TraB